MEEDKNKIKDTSKNQKNLQATIGTFLGRWDTKNIAVRDPGLQRYTRLDTPKITSFSMYASKRFGKAKYNVVERLANKLMVTGHLKDSRVHKRVSGRDTGKKQRTVMTVLKAFEEIEKKTKKNPIQVLVEAIENAAPREETTRIRHGGIIVHKAVDVSPQRRVDLALSFISHGAGQRAFKKKTKLSKALAEELISASNGDQKTYSISKRSELERVATSAR